MQPLTLHAGIREPWITTIIETRRRILEDGAVRTLKESVVIEIVRGARLRADIGNIYG